MRCRFHLERLPGMRDCRRAKGCETMKTWGERLDAIEDRLDALEKNIWTDALNNPAKPGVLYRSIPGIGIVPSEGIKISGYNETPKKPEIEEKGCSITTEEYDDLFDQAVEIRIERDRYKDELREIKQEIKARIYDKNLSNLSYLADLANKE